MALVNIIKNDLKGNQYKKVTRTSPRYMPMAPSTFRRETGLHFADGSTNMIEIRELSDQLLLLTRLHKKSGNPNTFISS